MDVYSILSRLFPNSFTAKIFFIAFIGTHVPLIITVWFLFMGHGGVLENLDIFLTVLLATLVGTAATLYGLKAILRPLYQVHAALDAFEQNREKIVLSHYFNDEIGEIMSMTNRLISSVDRDLRKRTDDARTDPLTQLMNRRGFEEAIAPGLTGSIIYADLDHFKRINDENGHATGDLVLKEVASTLRQALRKDDIVSRFGGEEFVAFLPETEAEEAKDIANRARLNISKQNFCNGLRITTSFGVSHKANNGSLKGAINLADKAVYIAKESGRNGVAYYAKGEVMMLSDR